MEYRQVGRSGLKLSAIGLGGWINFEEKLPTEEARRIVRAAYEGGVNFYDMADVYGNGEAERWLGGMLAGYPRHTLVLSSKVFFPMSDDVNDRSLSRKHIFESIDKTLSRLGTDYLDIYFCHRADTNTPLLETIRAMDDLIHQGKVLYWGTSEWPVETLRETMALCEANNLIAPIVDQPEYSMLHRTHVEKELLPAVDELGIGLTPYSPLAMGMLTGKYDDGIPEDSRFAREPWAKENILTEANVEKVRDLEMVAGELDITRAQLALAWVLRQPAVSSVITSATKLSQIEENLEAAVTPLAGDIVASIARILSD